MPPEPVRVSYISLFTRDVAALPDFYIAVFGLEEIAASRSDRYRELAVGDVRLGFPYIDAYARIGLQDQAEPAGVRAMITFAAASPDAVANLARRAQAAGARLTAPPTATDFGQVIAVLLDPEGNAFRISGALEG